MQYEEVFININPHWKEGIRFGFEFHAIKICVECGKLLAKPSKFSPHAPLEVQKVAQKENLCWDCALKKIRGGS